MTGPPEQPPPDHAQADQLEDRRRRADRATRGGMAAVLCLEAFVVLLVPRAIAQTSVGLTTVTTVVLVGFAALLVAAGFLLRRPWGVAVASALQLAFALTIVLVPIMALVVAFFLLIWWYLAQTRHQLVGTPGGWRMLLY
jgi:hypothetical protein